RGFAPLTDLQSRPLMDMDFATSCPLVRPVLPRIRLLFVRSRFRSTLPSDGPSQFRPCASLVLHLHQVAQGTFTPRLLDMPSTQDAARREERWPAAILDTGGEFDVRRMFQSEPPLINLDGAAQASLGAAPAGRGRQSCEFATSVIPDRGCARHLGNRQAGTKKPRVSAEQRNIRRWAAPAGQARGGRDYPR